MSKRVVFIDSSVADYQVLIDGLPSDAEWFVLGAASGGLEQMASILSGYSELDAIDVISHGRVGALYLGSTVLDSRNLSSYDAQLMAIGRSLTEAGDILLYGCNVAQGDVGLQFITSLAQYTGADVAASDDATGAGALGGDWVLEQAAGQVEVMALLGDTFRGLLAVNTTPMFGLNSGKLTTDFFGSGDGGYSITLQADGKILVAGIATSSSGNYDFALARYNANGSLDTSFDTDGKLTTDFFGSNDSGHSVTLQADGKILVAGYAGSDFALARYNANGSLDTSFDTDGKLTTDFFGLYDVGQSITLQADGKILVAGYATSSSSNPDFALARYNANGSLDTSFDTDGKLTTDFFGLYDEGYSITLQADGKILVAGVATSSSGSYPRDFALARYNANGSLDTSFDTDGKLTTDFFGSNDRGRSVTLQADGKILVAGVATISSSNYDFALARYNANGSLDTSFDTDGKLTTDFGSNDYGYSVTLQADGKILVAGYATNSSSNSGFALARYNANGSLDTSFGVAVSRLDGNPTYTGSSPVVLDADVQIYDADLGLTNNYSGSTLTLARHGAANVNDVFSAKASGTLSALTSGSFFSVGGVTMGLVVSNSNGTLQLGFNSNATQALVSATMQQIAYANTAVIPPAQAQINWTFSDGNTGAQGTGGALAAIGSTLVNITARNAAPVVANPLSDISLLPNTALNYALPANAFFDANEGESLVFSISMNDGTALPTWLVFNPVTRALSGNPGTPGAFDQRVFNIKATARDQTGATASDVFVLTIGTTISVSVSGVATQGQTLTAGNDLVSTGSVSYQWLSNGQPISGQTGNTLVLGQAQVGKTISVLATYSTSGGTSASATSDPTASIANINDLPVGVITIAGLPTQGQTLTASNTLTDADGLGAISYQWKADAATINGATSSTFILTQAQVGKAITVAASYTDGHGTAESLTSIPTTTVVSSDTTVPTVSAFSPTDEATGIAIGSDIVLSFSEAIARGVGNIVLKTAAGATVATYDAATSSNLTISGTTLTINPTADLAYSTGYKVEFAAGSVKDLAGNSYVGTTSYNFTTIADTTVPTVTLTGGPGSDTFNGGAGNDALDGGPGIDTAAFSGNRAASTITKTATVYTVSGATNGTDTLRGIERLQFADKKVALDLGVGEAAGNTVKIIGAAFGASSIQQRPDWVGTGLNLFDSGMSLLAVSDLVVSILGLSNTAFVNTVYSNVVGMLPSATERDYYVGLLQGSGGSMTQGRLLEIAAEVAMNAVNINLVGLQQSGVEFV